jgi:hypothetical protein
MKSEKLKHYIEDPHQKMIYEFIGRDIFSFHIELFKIFPADGVFSFPRCTKRVAELPKKAEQPVPVADVPAIPKAMMPKVVLPRIEELVKFDDIVEDEHELAAIETELGGLIEEASEEPSLAAPESEGTDDHDFLYGENEESEEDEKLDHIEDYEDIESLDKRLSGFDHDSDDY